MFSFRFFLFTAIQAKPRYPNVSIKTMLKKTNMKFLD